MEKLISNPLENKISFINRLNYSFKRILNHLFDKNINDSNIQKSIERNFDGKVGKKYKILEYEKLDIKTFNELHLKKGIPCIFRGAAKSWEAINKWSPKYFCEKYGNDKLPIMDNEISDGSFNVEEMLMSDFMNSIIEGKTKKYLRFGNLLHRYPELINDFKLDEIKKLMGKLKFGMNFGVFVGAKNTTTPLHSAPPDNLFVQVYGTKKWRIYDSKSDPALRPIVDKTTYFSTSFNPELPDFEEFPCAKFLNFYEFELRAGDILYNPPSYWHQVRNCDASFGVGFRWLSLKAFKLNFTQMILFFMATNPSIFFVMRNKKKYTNVLIKAQEKNKKIFNR